MTGAPLIGVVLDRKVVTSGPWVDIDYSGLPHTYLQAILDAGGVPLLLPAVEESIAQTSRFLDAIDGLFLPGGRDVAADFYGADAHAANDPPYRPRDEVELGLTKGAIARGMPVFGACRGMQVLNVALGGDLEQHLADRVDQTPHRDVVGRFTNHVVNVVPGSTLARVVGESSFGIASHHHQAVSRLGAGLRAVAFADDGVVEAVEGTDDDRFLLGVQWHPEERFVPHGRSLLRAFVEATESARV